MKGTDLLRVVKVRIYPNAEQQQLLERHFGAVRKVYNLLLDAKIKAFECGDSLGIYDLKKRLVPMKNSRDGQWLKEIDSTALQNAVINMGKAYDHFFRRVRNGEKSGFPRFKSKHHPRQSYQSSTVKIKNGKLYLPKIGLVKAVFHRDVVGIIKTVSISRESGQYHAAINFEDGQQETVGTNNGKSIGIDVGIKVFAYLSDGRAIKHVNLDKEIREVVKAQKVLSRRKKDGANREKAKAALAKKYLKLRNKRNDFLHKLSNDLSENQTIAVEDLKIKNMSRKAHASIDNPNMRLSGKRGLNRSILQQSWGRFFEMLDYKLARNGGSLVRVDPRYTSQTCHVCGHVSNKNRETQSRFKCKACGAESNADFNASVNILNAAGSAVKAF